MHKRTLTVLISESLKELAGHAMQINNRNFLSLSHSLHRGREIAMRLPYRHTVFKKISTLRRGDENNIGAGAATRSMIFSVMAELYHAPDLPVFFLV